MGRARIAWPGESVTPQFAILGLDDPAAVAAALNDEQILAVVVDESVIVIITDDGLKQLDLWVDRPKSYQPHFNRPELEEFFLELVDLPVAVNS